MKEIKRLTNSEMENVVGGGVKDTVFDVATITSGAVCVGSLVSSVGCKVGNLVWKAKASNALKRGDKETFGKFTRRANACSVAAASCVAGSVVGAAGFVVGLYTAGNGMWQSTTLQVLGALTSERG